MLKKLNRLTSDFEFHVTKKYGQKYKCDLFNAVFVVPTNYQGPPKIGFVIPNQLAKNATARNRIKRMLREAFYVKLSVVPENTWVTVYANEKILKATYEEICTQVNTFLQTVFIPK